MPPMPCSGPSLHAHVQYVEGHNHVQLLLRSSLTHCAAPLMQMLHNKLVSAVRRFALAWCETQKGPVSMLASECHSFWLQSTAVAGTMTYGGLPKQLLTIEYIRW